MPRASDTKGEAVKKREPVWEKEEEKLWLLETKRENPKGKIRDITIVGREATAKQQVPRAPQALMSCTSFCTAVGGPALRWPRQAGQPSPLGKSNTPGAVAIASQWQIPLGRGGQQVAHSNQHYPATRATSKQTGMCDFKEGLMGLKAQSSRHQKTYESQETT